MSFIGGRVIVALTTLATSQLPAPLSPIGRHEAVLVGAGDIARCDNRGDEATGALVRKVLDASDAAWAFTAGDNVYPNGTVEEFRSCYEPSWGAFRTRTLPCVGNHDARTPRSAGLRATFAGRFSQNGPLWYAADVKGVSSDGEPVLWRVVVLDSNCGDSDGPPSARCEAGSAQYQWLKDELRRQRARGVRCTVAIFHHPRFSSGPHGDADYMSDIWQALDDGGVDLVVSGHDHIYERFAPLDHTGAPKPVGMPSLIAGLGGASRYPVLLGRAGSVLRLNGNDGVVVLRLRPGGYSAALWTTDGAVHDVHEGRCR